MFFCMTCNIMLLLTLSSKINRLENRKKKRNEDK